MRSGSVFAVVAVLLLGSSPAVAQIVSGSIVDESTGGPVAGASVLLVDTAGVTRGGARTDTAGTWSLRAPGRTGWFRIRVQKAGYATVETAPFLVSGQPVTIRLTTRPALVVLEEVMSQQLAYDAFMSRRERRMGYAARIARFQPPHTAALMERLLPGMAINPPGGGMVIPRRPGSNRGCNPMIVVDGRRHDEIPADFRGAPPRDINDLVPVWEVRAIEI